MTKQVKISEFATVLRRLLDETNILTRAEWSELLRVSEAAISQWVNDHTLPRPELLRKIVWVVRNSSGVPNDILEDFDDMAIKPASQVSPHSDSLRQSVGHYLIQPLLRTFLGELSRLKPQEQEKFLLKASLMCTKDAGILTSLREMPVLSASQSASIH
jgi:hypothetical protein